MRRFIRILLILILFPATLSAVGGWFAGPMFLHPMKRPLTRDLIREADESFKHTHARREDMIVRAPDGTILRGWKVRAENPNGSWVLLFHGVSDNRVGVIGQSEFLLQNGYSVVMMDARCHGESGGEIGTYGWLEREDASAVIDALEASEKLQHLFALGESMGGGIVLQAAGADPRIEAVVAEASFADLQEAAYDYAGLRQYPWLGKTLLAPGAWLMVYRGGKLAGFPPSEVSPVKAVAFRAFPVLIICDEEDHALRILAGSPRVPYRRPRLRAWGISQTCFRLFRTLPARPGRAITTGLKRLQYHQDPVIFVKSAARVRVYSLQNAV